MHLGVLIYDGAFHSQTDGKSASMMFAACLLLLVVVFVLNILAVVLRARLRKRYLKG
jgi:phosphate transport system permease protein